MPISSMPTRLPTFFARRLPAAPPSERAGRIQQGALLDGEVLPISLVGASYANLTGSQRWLARSFLHGQLTREGRIQAESNELHIIAEHDGDVGQEWRPARLIDSRIGIVDDDDIGRDALLPFAARQLGEIDRRVRHLHRATEVHLFCVARQLELRRDGDSSGGNIGREEILSAGLYMQRAVRRRTPIEFQAALARSDVDAERDIPAGPELGRERAIVWFYAQH